LTASMNTSGARGCHGMQPEGYEAIRCSGLQALPQCRDWGTQLDETGHYQPIDLP